MYKCEKLNKKRLQQFAVLNDNRLDFNGLNEDFFEAYNKAGFAEQLYMRNQVKLLKYENRYIGFLWLKRERSRHYVINSMSVTEEAHIIDGCTALLDMIKNKTILEFNCIKNDFNFFMLERLGFKKGEGTIELIKSIDSQEEISPDIGLVFETFSRGKHEDVRCRLQNEIFKNNNREPLSLEDIYFDVLQEYFWDEGSIFIKLDENYIGYGQIINDSSIPTIVNFGIINDYRSKGYGKLLLEHLINILRTNGYEKVKIKVNSNNTRAYELYYRMGFRKVKEHYNWTLVL